MNLVNLESKALALAGGRLNEVSVAKAKALDSNYEKEEFLEIITGTLLIMNKILIYAILISLGIILYIPNQASAGFWDKNWGNAITPLDKKFYNDTLVFKFCNKSPNQVTIAIGYWKSAFDKGNFFITEGWWNVAPNQCKIPFSSGNLSYSSFYVNIQINGQSVTTSSFKTKDGDKGGTKGCVELGTFFLVKDESRWGKPCKTEEIEVPFLKIKNANQYNQYTFYYK